jgi:hypothetical protein
MFCQYWRVVCLGSTLAMPTMAMSVALRRQDRRLDSPSRLQQRRRRLR